jgi:protein-S-isoprenylcysteine O-methyltransferase Ste14
MKIGVAWSTGWPGPWALGTFAIIYYAWAATGVYFIVAALRTNRTKRRETIGARLVDRVLLFGGYALLFSQAPFPGAPNYAHFVQPREALAIAGVVFTYVGLPLTVWSRVRLGRFWSGWVVLKQDHRLIQSGPYRVVRHPLYSGIIVAAIGMALCITTWSSLLGVASLITCFERRAHKEDALLATEFGEEFESYRQRTGRLLPRMG